MFKGKKTNLGLIILGVCAILNVCGIDIPVEYSDKIIQGGMAIGAIIAAFGLGDKGNRILKALLSD